MMSFPTRLGTHAKYLGLMMRSCGVQPEDLAHDRLGLTFAAVARACMVCRHTERCRNWLESADPDKVNDPPSFCPNAARFAAARICGSSGRSG
jgi:hypothetical protein